MAEEIDAATIKKTQEILGSVIKKPALSEKSLKKPPFKFLHDIISSVIKNTGFFKGLYTSAELQSENVKDKESKIAFLQKAIDVLALVTNHTVNLKPSKVVAGHDPHKTNQFLQTLGTAIKNKLDSSEAVEKVLNQKLQNSPTKVPKERRASVDKRTKGSNEKAHSRSLTKTLDPVKKSSSSQNKETPKNEKSKDKHKDSKKEREKSRDRSKHKTEDSKKKERKQKEEIEAKEERKIESEKSETNDIDQNEKQILNSEESVEPATSMMNGGWHKEEIGDGDGIDQTNEKLNREKSHRSHSSRSARPPSARSKRTKPAVESDASVVEGTFKEHLMPIVSDGSSGDHGAENMFLARPPSARPPSARPSSSRPAPPRIRIKHVIDNEMPSLRPATAKPVENVILDQGHQSDEEETFILMDSETTENLDVQNSTLSAKTPDEDKGSLVKKLLETKKDLESGSQQSPTKKVEIDKSQMSEASRARERDSASKELGQLRSFVQSLSKTAVPLGRMLDFLQEDLDAMKMERKMWKEEHEQNLTALHKEQNATESLLEPLRAQLDDLDQVVQNQFDANSALKATIARNDERIQRMLASVNNKS